MPGASQGVGTISETPVAPTCAHPSARLTPVPGRPVFRPLPSSSLCPGSTGLDGRGDMGEIGPLPRGIPRKVSTPLLIHLPPNTICRDKCNPLFILPDSSLMRSWERPLTPDHGSESDLHMYFESPEALKGRAGGFPEFQGHLDPAVICLAWSRVHFSMPVEERDPRVVESHPDPHWAVALGQPQNTPWLHLGVSAGVWAVPPASPRLL